MPSLESNFLQQRISIDKLIANIFRHIPTEQLLSLQLRTHYSPLRTALQELSNKYKMLSQLKNKICHNSVNHVTDHIRLVLSNQ